VTTLKHIECKLLRNLYQFTQNIKERTHMRHKVLKHIICKLSSWQW